MHAYRIASPAARGPRPPRFTWRLPRAGWIVVASATLHVAALVVAARAAPDDPPPRARSVRVLRGQALANGDVRFDGEHDAVIRNLR